MDEGHWPRPPRQGVPAFDGHAYLCDPDARVEVRPIISVGLNRSVDALGACLI